MEPNVYYNHPSGQKPRSITRGVSFDETLNGDNYTQHPEEGDYPSSNYRNSTPNKDELKGLEVPTLGKQKSILISDSSFDSPMVSNSYVLTASDDEAGASSIGGHGNNKWNSNLNSSIKERTATMNTINDDEEDDNEPVILKNFTDDAFDRYILYIRLFIISFSLARLC